MIKWLKYWIVPILLVLLVILCVIFDIQNANTIAHNKEKVRDMIDSVQTIGFRMASAVQDDMIEVQDKHTCSYTWHVQKDLYFKYIDSLKYYIKQPK